MKKLFALVLAVAMVLSLAAVSFATVDGVLVVNETAMVESDGEISGQLVDTREYGKSVYYLLGGSYEDPADAEGGLVNVPGQNGGIMNQDLFGDANVYALGSADNVKGIKAKATWTENGDLVESVSIVKKRVRAGVYSNTQQNTTNAEFTAYFVQVKFANKSTTASTDVYGKIEVSKGSLEYVFNPFITLRTERGDNDTIELGKDDRIYEFVTENEDPDNGKIEGNDEQEFELYGGAGYFVVDTRGQGKILLSNTVEVAKRAEIEATYPDINFYYFNGNGAQFNKTGELKLSASPDQFLYKVGADGVTLTKVDAEYDDVDECFVVKTRVLGQYAIADEELDLTLQEVAEDDDSAIEVVPGDEVSPENPSTGAAA